MSSATDGPSIRSLIEAGRGDMLMFGVTPPRRSTEPERLAGIAERTKERLAATGVDGLVLYDIDDESDRNHDPRPFPYVATMDPDVYRRGYLEDYPKPCVIYRCVGKYDEEELSAWLREQPDDALTVFVGASSGNKPVQLSLPRAMQLKREVRPELPLGGVAIPERHRTHGDEHLRLIRKQQAGCSFFITQVVYNLNAAKDVVSEYFYACSDRGVTPAPIIFTLSLCGSEKTLDFLQWLGVNVPTWVQNELRRERDTLDASLRFCHAVAEDLTDFCRNLGLPFGFNIESVSNRRAEIEAAVELTHRVRRILEG